MPAEKAGLKKGDVLLKIQSKPILFFEEAVEALQENKGKSIEVTLLRKTDTLLVKATVTQEGTIGFKPHIDELPTVVQTYGLFESIPLGAGRAFKDLAMQVTSLGKIFSGQVKATNAMQGPIGIATKLYGSTWNWQRFWSITALLSLVLAIMNILPIPALDGGHVLFLLVEIVRGKPLNDKIMERVQMAGMILLMSLIVFVLGNDIWKNFLK